MSLKFSHIADCHLGAWNAHPDLREMPLKAFGQAVEKSIEEKVNFIVIAGDFFDTSMPAIDVIRFAAEKLRICKEAGIPVYAIAGSHDFSPTGKTILSVFESAGLLVNVHQKLVKDRSGCQIFGIEGLRQGLDKETFESFDFMPVLENLGDDAFNIFVFHAAIREYCPIPMMEAMPLDLLPDGFDYYATGHVHYVFNDHSKKGLVAFPGPLFQVSFHELEKLESTGFYIVHVEGKKPRLEWRCINSNRPYLIFVDGNEKTPSQIESEFIDRIDKSDLKDKIVLLKSEGRLKSGKASDIGFSSLIGRCMEKGAHAVKRSAHLSVEQVETAIETTGMKDIEKEVIQKLIEKNPEIDKNLVEQLIDVLKEERAEDEKSSVYEEKIKSNLFKVLKI